MRKLLQGIVDFRDKVSKDAKTKFTRLAVGQSPDALFIACSDSRVAPNVFASTDPGDLFVHRNVGNLIPPCASSMEGTASGCEAAAAAVEFAVLNLQVTSIIICGHSECGAIQNILTNCCHVNSPNLKAWLQHGMPARDKLANAASYLTSKTIWPPHNLLSQLNVLSQIENLLSYPFIKARYDEQNLKIYGWWFDIATTDMYSYHEELKQFVLLDEHEADRLRKTLPS